MRVGRGCRQEARYGFCPSHSCTRHAGVCHHSHVCSHYAELNWTELGNIPYLGLYANSISPLDSHIFGAQECWDIPLTLMYSYLVLTHMLTRFHKPRKSHEQDLGVRGHISLLLFRSFCRSWAGLGMKNSFALFQSRAPLLLRLPFPACSSLLDILSCKHGSCNIRLFRNLTIRLLTHGILPCISLVCTSLYRHSCCLCRPLKLPTCSVWQLAIIN